MVTAGDFTQVNFSIWHYQGKKNDYTYQQYSPAFDTVSHAAKMGGNVLIYGRLPIRVFDFEEALEITNEMEGLK